MKRTSGCNLAHHPKQRREKQQYFLTKYQPRQHETNLFSDMIKYLWEKSPKLVDLIRNRPHINPRQTRN